MSNCTSYPLVSPPTSYFGSAGYGVAVVTITPASSSMTCGFSIPVWLMPTQGTPWGSVKYVRFQTGPQSAPYQNISYCYNDPPNGDTSQQCFGPNSQTSTSQPFYSSTTPFMSFTNPTSFWLTVYNGVLTVGSGTMPGDQSTVLGTATDAEYLDQVIGVSTNNLNFEASVALEPPECPTSYALDENADYGQQCLEVQGCFPGAACSSCYGPQNSAPADGFCFTVASNVVTLPFGAVQGIVDPHGFLQAPANSRSKNTRALITQRPIRSDPTTCTNVNNCSPQFSGNPCKSDMYVMTVPSNACGPAYTNCCVAPAGSDVPCSKPPNSDGSCSPCPEGCVATSGTCQSDASCASLANTTGDCIGCCSNPSSICSHTICNNQGMTANEVNCACWNSWFNPSPLAPLCMPCAAGLAPQIIPSNNTNGDVYFTCVPSGIQVNMTINVPSGVLSFQVVDANVTTTILAGPWTITDNDSQTVTVGPGQSLSITDLEVTEVNNPDTQCYFPTQKFRWCPFILTYTQFLSSPAEITFAGSPQYNCGYSRVPVSQWPYQACVGTMTLTLSANITYNTSTIPWLNGCDLYPGVHHCNDCSCPVNPA